MLQVVEYSEITPSAARLRNEDDSLTYWAANLCIHFFTLDFLRRVCNKHERELASVQQSLLRLNSVFQFSSQFAFVFENQWDVVISALCWGI